MSHKINETPSDQRGAWLRRRKEEDLTLKHDLSDLRVKIRTMKIEPGDMIVVRSDDCLTVPMVSRFRGLIRSAIPNVGPIVMMFQQTDIDNIPKEAWLRVRDRAIEGMQFCPGSGVTIAKGETNYGCSCGVSFTMPQGRDTVPIHTAPFGAIATDNVSGDGIARSRCPKCRGVFDTEPGGACPDGCMVREIDKFEATHVNTAPDGGCSLGGRVVESHEYPVLTEAATASPTLIHFPCSSLTHLERPNTRESITVKASVTPARMPQSTRLPDEG